MQTPDATGAAGPTIAETLTKLGANDKAGLTDAEVQARLKKYGPNALVEKQKNAFTTLLAYFWGPIPWMIKAAALMAFIVGDWGDFAIITSLLLFNALLGFWEEHYFLAKGSAVIDSFLLIGFLLGVWMVPRFGRIRMQVIGFAGMGADMLIL